MQLDHVIVFCPPKAEVQAAALSRAGLVEGPPNSHPGQGTACRRFFLRNAYLELLWVRDEAEARLVGVRELGLYERAASVEACPFGIVLRRSGTGPRFETWSYRPQYLPDGIAIEVACGVATTEPAVFYLPFVDKVHGFPSPPLTMDGVTIHTPCAEAASAAMREMEAVGIIRLRPAEQFHLDLTVGGLANLPCDLRPTLPVVLSAPVR